MRTSPNLGIFLVAFLAVSACVTTTQTRLYSDLGPRRVQVLGSWDVLLEGELVGRFSRMVIHDPTGAQEHYRVERSDGQEVGWIDLEGRAFRFEPFSDEPVLVAMDRMTEDLRVLLELEREPRVAGPRALESSARPVEAVLRR